MERPSRDQVCMGMAQLASVRSTCSRLNVGACSSLDGRVVLTAYNGTPAGMPHCDHSCDCESSDVAGQITGDEIGRHLSDCASQRPCTAAVHAEANLVAFAAKHGISLLGTDIFTTDSPCVSCSQLLVNIGIGRMVFAREYRDTSGLVLIRDAGILVQHMDLIPWSD